MYKWRFDVCPKDRTLEISVLETNKSDAVFGHNGLVKQRDENGRIQVLQWCFKHGTGGWSKGIRKMNGILAEAERWIGSRGDGTPQFKAWKMWCETLFTGWDNEK